MNTMTEGGATASTMNDTTSLKPDPFSELRGLMERAHAMSPLPWGTAKEGGTYFMCSGLPESWVATFDGTEEHELVLAAVNSLGALLDERDRLIGQVVALSRALIDTPVLMIDGAAARALGEDAAIEYLHSLVAWLKTHSGARDTARQALSQEIG